MKLTDNSQHGSDSGTYDNEGRFAPQNFENIFAKYDSDHDGAISLSDIFRLMKGQRVVADPFGVSSCLFLLLIVRLLILDSGEQRYSNGAQRGCYFKKMVKCTRRICDRYMMYEFPLECYCCDSS